MTRPLGGAADRPRADRDPLVLPLHPVVPAVRAGGDGARLAAARPATPAPRPSPRASARARAAAGGRMTSAPGAALSGRGAGRSSCGLVPLQLGVYADAVITDIPTYQAAYDHISAGDVPYRRLLAGVPAAGRRASSGWPGCCRGPTPGRSPVLMLLALCATVVGRDGAGPGARARRAAPGAGRRGGGGEPAAGRQPGGDALRPRAGRDPGVDPLGGRHRALRADVGPAGRGDPAEAGPAGPDPGVRDLAAPPRRHAPARLGRRRREPGRRGRRDRAVRDHVALGDLGPRRATTSTARSSSSRSARPTCSGCTRWPTSRSRSRAPSAARASTEPVRR